VKKANTFKSQLPWLNEVNKKSKGDIDEMFFGNAPNRKELLTAINPIFDNIKSLTLS
jgi:hypothetical protein